MCEIFDFENCKFRDSSVCKEEYNFLKSFRQNENNIKKWSDKNIKKIIKRYDYKFTFKGVTNHCYWYTNKVVYSDDANFFYWLWMGHFCCF